MKPERIDVYTATVAIDNGFYPDKKLVECYFHTEKEALIWAERKTAEFKVAYSTKEICYNVWKNEFPAFYEERYFD